jgi:hypothetical protein
MPIEYRSGSKALPVEAFLALAQRVWPRSYDAERAAQALTRTANIGAWNGDRSLGRSACSRIATSSTRYLRLWSTPIISGKALDAS